VIFVEVPDIKVDIIYLIREFKDRAFLYFVTPYLFFIVQLLAKERHVLQIIVAGSELFRNLPLQLTYSHLSLSRKIGLFQISIHIVFELDCEVTHIKVI